MRRMLFVYGIFKSFIGGSLWDLDIFLELSTKMPVAEETERPMVLRKKCCCMIAYAECQMVLNKVFTRLTHGYQMGRPILKFLVHSVQQSSSRDDVISFYSVGTRWDVAAS
jgi:hypothetical protein